MGGQPTQNKIHSFRQGVGSKGSRPRGAGSHRGGPAYPSRAHQHPRHSFLKYPVLKRKEVQGVVADVPGLLRIAERVRASIASNMYSILYIIYNI